MIVPCDICEYAVCCCSGDPDNCLVWIESVPTGNEKLDSDILEQYGVALDES